ncbi:efflux RND transporter periplasmic adaptor subunit [Glaciecola petra]|uniref:Efflux RND transporter periplasmic adaptor subunit n=1 Tax=Glaciecola petra TaxID=3075602 RepID=A0ABU2ZWA8_9ALTE|nr:efflux RND transporter periplasmic adaptor subunit [Aestuariibacter sp. P117]MDT0596661.1 efflux RND transporter periplasmic adaptor subunit [Aestuariibacter sp. P117]
MKPHVLMVRVAIVAAVLGLLGACAQEQTSTIPLYAVDESDFAIEVKGFGEVQAAQSQKILTPGRRPMTLSWLKPENTYVEKGDIIARFDANQILKDSREEELELMRLDQDILKSNAQQRQAKQDVDSDQTFVRQEFEFVDKFAIDDLRIYSQLEIIDTLANRDFLEAKDIFLDWKETSIVEQHSNEMAVLDIRKQGVETKFKQHQAALTSLEVVSPYGGLLVYEKDRRGEKPAVGQTVFPGRPIAQIPNLDNMQASVFVQANDAIDLNKGQGVTIRLDAFPEKSFKGEIADVSGFPRSIERGNPVTYFEVTVTLLEQDKSMMQPGRKLTATIDVKAPSKKLVVPLQALHFDEGSSYVYLQDGSTFKRQNVTSGRKNLFLVEITEGLASGDIIALSQPEQNAIQES